MSVITTGIGHADQARIAEHLAALLDSELPLGEALAAVARDARTPRLRACLEGLAAGVSDGRSLDDCLRQQGAAFGPLLSELIRAGEASGRLADVLRHAALHHWRLAEFVTQVRHLLFYPLMVLLLGVVVLGGTGVMVWPVYASFIEELGLSRSSSWYLIDALLRRPLLLGSFLLAGCLMVVIAWRLMGRWLRYRLLPRLPLCGVYLRAVFVQRFCRTLALFLGSGVGLPEALAVLAQLDRSSGASGDLKALHTACADGSQLSDALARHLPRFPALGLGIIRSGEQSGRLSEALEEVAHASDVTAERELMLLHALVQPIALFLVGLVIFFMIRAMIAPLFTAIEHL